MLGVVVLMSLGAKSEESANVDVSEGHPHYYLHLQVSNANTLTTVNGLWLDSIEGSGTHSSPINHRLIGSDNTVRVKVSEPAPETKPGQNSNVSVPSDAKVKLSIKTPEGKAVSPETGDVVAQTTLEDVIEARRSKRKESFKHKIKNATESEKKDLRENRERHLDIEFPIELELSFDSTGVPAFDTLLSESPVIEKKAALKAYGMKLKTLLEKRKLDAFTNQMERKFRDYSKAYRTDGTPNPRRGFRKMLENMYYPGDTFLDFNRDDLNLKRWCGGRIWEIEVDRDSSGNSSFLHSSKDSSIYSMDIFVARIDGSLRIVR